MSTRLTRRPFRLALFAAALAMTPAVSSAQHTARGPNIPQVARTAGQFSTLLAAVEAGMWISTCARVVDILALDSRRSRPPKSNL